MSDKKKVLILEKTCAGAATPHAAGILDPFVDLDFRSEILGLTLPALKKYPAMIRKLETATRKKTGYQHYPLLYLAFNKKDEKKLRAFHRRPETQKKMNGEWLDLERIRKLEPQISEKVRGGLCFKAAARVIPEQLSKVLRAWLKQNGARFEKTGKKAALLVQNNRAEGIRLGSRSIWADNTVGCLGAWAGLDQKSSVWHEPIEPLRGQISVYRRRKPMRVLLHTLDGGYLIPWTPGKILAGSTVEHAGFKSHVTAAGKKKIQHYAERLLPELAGVRPTQRWAGLRPRSLARMPRIGKTRISGYYVANGYFRCGLLIGIYAGELLAQAISTGRNPRELRPFIPVY